MSQAIQPSPPVNNATTINHSQVAPQGLTVSNQQEYPDPQKQKVNTSRSSHDMVNPTSRHPAYGAKHGFLSLLFCCASDTSAWMDPNISKSSSPSTTTSKTTQQQQQQDTVRSKRKKKHWFSRWYHPKQTGSQHDQLSQSQQRRTSTLNNNNDRIDTNNIPSTTITIPQDKINNTSTTTNPLLPTPVTDTQSGQLYPIEMTETGPVSWLLPPISSDQTGRKCLVLDLDETLVHSSFKIIPNPDFVVPVEIDQQVHNVYVLKRPGVDEFMRKMGEKYEIVVFTASLSKYADPVLDILDKHRVVKHRLFRESCFNHKGSYVKDLSQLGRDLATTLILDNSPTSYLFHTSNAVPVSTWFNDPHDTELTDLVEFLYDLAFVDDVTLVLDSAIEPSSNVAMK